MNSVQIKNSKGSTKQELIKEETIKEEVGSTAIKLVASSADRSDLPCALCCNWKRTDESTYNYNHVSE